MLDEQKMLQMIASEPLIRTVVLADRLDCDIQDVEDALLPMVNRGRIVAQPVMGPNNRRATGYSLSDEQRGEILRESKGVSIDVSTSSPIDQAVAFIAEHGTITGAQLHAFMDLPPEAVPSNILAEALADGRLFKDGKYWTLGAASRCAAVASLSEAHPETDPKVSRALAFIADNGTATDQQLRKAMGIGKDAPAEYLAEHIKAGKLHKTSWHWKIGPRPAGSTPAFRISDEKGPVAAFGPEVQPEEVADLPDALVAELSKPAQQVVSAVRAEAERAAPAPTFPIASFRCGMFSDGVLELHRDGKVIAALSPDEVDHVAQFIDRRAA